MQTRMAKLEKFKNCAEKEVKDVISKKGCLQNCYDFKQTPGLVNAKYTCICMCFTRQELKEILLRTLQPCCHCQHIFSLSCQLSLGPRTWIKKVQQRQADHSHMSICFRLCAIHVNTAGHVFSIRILIWSLHFLFPSTKSLASSKFLFYRRKVKDLP